MAKNCQNLKPQLKFKTGWLTHRVAVSLIQKTSLEFTTLALPATRDPRSATGHNIRFAVEVLWLPLSSILILLSIATNKKANSCVVSITYYHEIIEKRLHFSRSGSRMLAEQHWFLSYVSWSFTPVFPCRTILSERNTLRADKKNTKFVLSEIESVYSPNNSWEENFSSLVNP